MLGQGWAKEGYSASTLDPTSRGVGFLLAEGAVPVKIRTHYLDDDAIAELAQLAVRPAFATSPGIAVRSAAEWREVLAEVDQAGLCAHPIRLRGLTLDRSSGELVEGGLVVAVQGPASRRLPVVLPPLPGRRLAAGGRRASGAARGSAPSVVGHPQLFVTLTAPSFGPVHRGDVSDDATRRCADLDGVPRLCPHGELAVVHAPPRRATTLRSASRCARSASTTGGRCCGTPTCLGLWDRTSHRLYREVAQAAGLSTTELRSVARLSYMKVVEFQRRGLVHLHVVVRADGGAGPSEHAATPGSTLALLTQGHRLGRRRGRRAGRPTRGHGTAPSPLGCPTRRPGARGR